MWKCGQLTVSFAKAFVVFVSAEDRGRERKINMIVSRLQQKHINLEIIFAMLRVSYSS